MESCNKKGFPYASIWGHSPHYVTTSPNPRVSHALLTRLKNLVDFDIDMQELRLSAEAFETEISRAIAKQPDVSGYVEKLERRHDEAHTPTEEIPSPEIMVEELEEFLKSQSQQSDNPDND
jgi:proteasome assembly chaperone (PAC2) family protein